MKLTWIGHACFKLEENGYTVIFDPYAEGSVPGLKDVQETADLVICSHEHGDHNGRNRVQLRTGEACPWKLTQIQTYHDEVKGAKRGPNTITIVESGENKVAHFGDLGCELSSEEIELLKDLDVAMIPVGGFFTIDAAAAKELVDQIQPKTVIPMHFRSGDFGYDVIGTVNAFTELFEKVCRSESCEYTVSKNTAEQVVVLTPANK